MVHRTTLGALAAMLLCGLAAALPTIVVQQDCASDRDCLFSMTCANNKCVCKDGYHLYKNSCLGGIDASCNYDDDCIVDAFCQNHRTCACMEPLVRNNVGSKCEGNVTKLGRITDSNCHENYDCEQYGNAFCEAKTNMCQCRFDSHLRGGRCWESRKLGENCLSTDQCYTPRFSENVDCDKSNHTCVCVLGSRIATDQLSCELVEQDCASDRDCLFSMTCANNKCVCKDGYHLYKNSCLGGIDAPCTFDQDCIVDAYCYNHRKCACMVPLVRNDDGSKCEGNVAILGRIADSNCHENYDCEQYGNAFCEAKTNMCQCRFDSHLRNETCILYSM